MAIDLAPGAEPGVSDLSKVVPDPRRSVADIPDGAVLAVGGFGSCGIPSLLIDALRRAGRRGLHVVSNNCGIDGWGLGILLEAGQIDRVTASYVGDNKEFARRYLSGELEVELVPQGTLAERLRAGGAGIPAFFTPAGVGTQIAEGGLPWRYGADGTVAAASPPRRTEVFNGREYVLEHAVRADFGLVRAWKGDTLGNLVFRRAARNFNPLCAMSGRITIAEVEELYEPGEIDPDEVHLPGVFVQRVVPVPPDGPGAEKRIEKLTERRTAPSTRESR
ncbi:CoA transferase subunit A [Actinomadura sp. OS1-43]|uniref:CoA transferase subunit A n=1 Tax=Actinomadura sp. OS1-43 TaxID=604315 RepID=UPI00255A740A|nr:CoA transferase subunit A [Actinomadura sp. OS1-43]MDL4817315.1 CoA transferase subunit A [Actinomadura sp. OS1-43]